MKKITIRKNITNIDRFGWNEQFRRDLKTHAGKMISLRDYHVIKDGSTKTHRFNLHSSDDGLNWHNNGEWYINDMTDKQFKQVFNEHIVTLPEDLFTL